VDAQSRWQHLAAEAHQLTSTSSGMAWEQQMIQTHNAFWAQIVKACEPEAKAASITSFNAIASIDSSGGVTEFLTNPESPALQCFSKQMIGRKYPSPPESPFYEFYTIDLNAGS
ncbi:MAG: hypothetical protein KGJ55_06190, partial [Gammaproteobacteria bacterium]|nr:hypothetical protein [Gammaproteobacteria bacterium]